MKYKVAVVGGAGHIGLPLSCYIQNAGIDTSIIDTNEENIDKINSFTPPFLEHDLDNQLKKALSSGLKAFTQIEEIKNCEIVIVTLGTSSNQQITDKFHQLIETVILNMKEGSTLILRSTVTIETINSVIEGVNFSSKKIDLFYCPERIAEGKAFLELDKIPQIIGSKDSKSGEIIDDFFEKLKFRTIFVNYEEAVFIKLFLNTYRYAQFSTINYFDNIASNNSLDFKKLLTIASDTYPRLENVPDSGLVGGPCLIKDSQTFLNSYGDPRDLITNYFNINDDYIKNTIDKCNSYFQDKKIVQLGLTFKPDSDDLRDSQAIVLNNYLIKEGFEVKTFDPYINDEAELESVLDFSDNILIATHHKIFDSYDLESKKVVVVGDK